MPRRILVLDFDNTITGYAKAQGKNLELKKRLLSIKMVEFANQVIEDPVTKKQVRKYEAVYGCTHRCLYMLRDYFDSNSSKVQGLGVHPKHIFVTKIVENFEYATGLKFIAISTPDDKYHSVGAGYRNIVEPYENIIIKGFDQGSYPDFFSIDSFSAQQGYQYVPFNRYGINDKNEQLMQIIKHVSQRYVDDYVILDFVDDDSNVRHQAGQLRETNIPVNITLNVHDHFGSMQTDVILEKTIYGMNDALVAQYRGYKISGLLNEALGGLDLQHVSRTKRDEFRSKLFGIVSPFYNFIDSNRSKMIAAIRENIKITASKILFFTCSFICNIEFKGSEKTFSDALTQALAPRKESSTATSLVALGVSAADSKEMQKETEKAPQAMALVVSTTEIMIDAAKPAHIHQSISIVPPLAQQSSATAPPGDLVTRVSISTTVEDDEPVLPQRVRVWR